MFGLNYQTILKKFAKKSEEILWLMVVQGKDEKCMKMLFD